MGYDEFHRYIFNLYKTNHLINESKNNIIKFIMEQNLNLLMILKIMG